MGDSEGGDPLRTRREPAVSAVGPARSLRDQLSSMFRLLVGGGLAISLVLAGWLTWMLAVSQPSVDRLQRATALVEALDVRLQAEQSDLRAYLASGGPSYLQDYRSSTVAATTGSAELSAEAGSIASTQLIAFEIALQEFTSGWADRVADGTLSAGAGHGRAADVAQLTQALAQGRQLFTAYDAADLALSSTLQGKLDSARSAQNVATVVAAGLALMLAIGTAAIGVRRQTQLSTSVVGPMRDIGLGLGALMRGEYDAVDITPGGPAELHGMSTLVLRLSERLAARKAQDEVTRELERQRTARTDVILGVAREVAGSLNLRYVLESVAAAAADIFGATGARLWLVEQPGAPMLLSFDTAYGRAGIREPVELDLGSGVAGRAAKYGRPALGEGAEIADGVPVVAVPLIVGARVVGALECAGGEPREIGEDVLTSLETLATHAAAAIEASRLHQAAEEMSVTDALTGLANRRQLDRDLPTEVDRATRYHRPLSVLFLDLDHFKQLNDRYGHSYGDLVLQQVGEVLRSELRTVDRAYRMGGEEFVIVAPESAVEDGTGLAERLRMLIARATSANGTTAGVTASFGVATLPDHGTTGPALLAVADAALYDAKSAGRNQVRVASEASGAVPEQRAPYALPPVAGRASMQVEPREPAPLEDQPAV
jgi:diguanylate cyclase (GGDEF)-like protein